MSARVRLAMMVLLAGSAVATPVWSQQPPAGLPKLLTVELASGRRFTGLVDATSSDERLVLRFTRGRVSLTRPIEWGRIVKAIVAEQAIDPAKVREVALAMRVEGSGFRVQELGIVREGEAPAEPSVQQQRVTSVTFDARIANWDGDVETDGLIVELYPLSGEGYLAPARGTVEVELFAPQKRVFHHAPLSGGDTLERIERWTRTVDAAEFGASGARLKLPFGAVHPEFDLDWIGVGLVHVRLVVPGDGVFEDSVDGLRIRPYAPLRDRLEMNTGRRFVPTEGLGRRN